MHLAFTLLPDENRDMAELLFIFFCWISSHSGDDDPENIKPGNRMNLSNMATVITPNILYSKNITQDESFFANEVVLSILESIQEFIQV